MSAELNILVVTEGACAARRIRQGRTAPANALDTVDGEPPSVVVVDADVARQTAVGRTALRRWPMAKVVFLAEPEKLSRLQSSLPFWPDLAGAVAVSNAVTTDELMDIVARLAETAERDRAISGLYQRLNSAVQNLGASKAALHERQSQLLLAERYLATVLDHAPQALISTDLEGVIVTCNQVATDLFRFPTGDCAGLPLAELFTAESRKVIIDSLAQAAAGRSLRREAQIAHPDGDLTVEFGAAPVLGPNGGVAALSIAVLDISQRKRMEAELAESNRRLNAVLNNATVAIFLMDHRQHCAYMNDAAERLTGYTWEETQGRPLHDVIHHTRPDGSHYPIHDCPIDRAFPENHQQQGEDVFVHKDGRFYDVAFTASPIRDEESRTIGTIIEVRDITEEKRNQESRELLMREVDHRARNVLAVAQSMVQLTKAPDVEDFREALLGRISALARAQAALSKTSWQGALLENVVRDELATFGRADHFQTAGPEIMLHPEEVQPLGMIMHELATNAAKYGAFSTPDGCVRVGWTRDTGSSVRLAWQEIGGPPVRAPNREGFGSRLIRRLAKQLNGEVAFDWNQHGLSVELVIGSRPRSGRWNRKADA